MAVSHSTHGSIPTEGEKEPSAFMGREELGLAIRAAIPAPSQEYVHNLGHNTGKQEM